MKNTRVCREQIVPELDKLWREMLSVIYRIRSDSGYNIEVGLTELSQQLDTIAKQAKEIEA